MVTNHEEYMTFWENVARKYVPISHDVQNNFAFSRVIDSSRSPFQPYYYTKEFFEEISEMKYPCLIAESTSARFSNSQGDFGDYKGAIVVLDSTNGEDDQDSINKAVSSCEKHCKKLMGFLRNYLRENPLKGKLLSGSLIIHPIGPISDSLFGARAEFTIKAQDCDFKVVDSDWSTDFDV